MVLKFLQLNLWTLARFCYSSFLLQPHLLNKYVKSKYWRAPWLVWLSGLSAGLRTERSQVAGSIPGQGTCLGCRPGPHLGACERQLDQCFSPSSMFLSLLFSLPSPLSENK